MGKARSAAIIIAEPHGAPMRPKASAMRVNAYPYMSRGCQDSLGCAHKQNDIHRNRVPGTTPERLERHLEKVRATAKGGCRPITKPMSDIFLRYFNVLKIRYIMLYLMF